MLAHRVRRPASGRPASGPARREDVHVSVHESRRRPRCGFPAGGVLASTDEGLLIAVTAGGSVEEHHFRGAPHRHLKLVPSPTPAGDRTGPEPRRSSARQPSAAAPASSVAATRSTRFTAVSRASTTSGGSTRATTSSWTSSVHRLKPTSETSSGPPIARVSSPSMPTTPTVGCAGVSAGDLGVAVQSKFPGVGSLVPYGEAEVGVVATQGFGNPRHGSARPDAAEVRRHPTTGG